MNRFLAAILLMSIGGIGHGGDLKLLLRYDDFSGSSDYAVEEALFAAAEQAGGGVLVGVIPFQGKNCWDLFQRNSSLPTNLGQRKREQLRDYHAKGVVEVAAHGCSHKSVWDNGLNSEFVGVKPIYQTRLLKFVRRSLEGHLGLPVTTFVPPFNTYDDNTLVAMEEAGFELLSAGVLGNPIDDSTIKILPGGLYPANIRAFVTAALDRGVDDGLMTVTIHPYDIRETGRTLPGFRKSNSQVGLRQLVEDILWVGRQPGIELVSVAGLLASNPDLSAARQAANLRLKRSVIAYYDLLPAMLAIYPARGVYYGTDGADWIMSQQLLRVVVFYTVLMLLVVVVARLSLRALSARLPALRYLVLAAALLGIAAMLFKGWYSGLHLASASLLAGCVGLLLASVRPARPAGQPSQEGARSR